MNSVAKGFWVLIVTIAIIVIDTLGVIGIWVYLRGLLEKGLETEFLQIPLNSVNADGDITQIGHEVSLSTTSAMWVLTITFLALSLGSWIAATRPARTKD